jgi:hypothetical protein
VRRVIGMILLVLGILLTVGSGLCTSIGVITMIGDGSGGEMSGGGMIGLVIFVGSWFFVPGALMWWGGLKLRRGRKPPDATEDSNG